VLGIPFVALSTCARMWEELRSSSVPPLEENRSKWEAEFNQLMSSERDELDYGGLMQEAWENGLGEFSNDDQLQSQYTHFDDEGIPLLPDYTFGKLS
jgi:peroxin-5